MVLLRVYYHYADAAQLGKEDIYIKIMKSCCIVVESLHSLGVFSWCCIVEWTVCVSDCERPAGRVVPVVGA